MDFHNSANNGNNPIKVSAFKKYSGTLTIRDTAIFLLQLPPHCKTSTKSATATRVNSKLHRIEWYRPTKSSGSPSVANPHFVPPQAKRRSNYDHHQTRFLTSHSCISPIGEGLLFSLSDQPQRSHLHNQRWCNYF